MLSRSLCHDQTSASIVSVGISVHPVTIVVNKLSEPPPASRCLGAVTPRPGSYSLPKVAGKHIMAVGTVKWFNPQKGFGFILPESGGADVFVHISAVEKAGLATLSDGQKVSFDVGADRSGKMSAINLKAS